MLGIRDARSGKWVRRGQRIRYSDGNWWCWLDWQYRIADRGGDEAVLLVQSEYKPQGYWQPCPTWYGGLIWMFPS